MSDKRGLTAIGMVMEIEKDLDAKEKDLIESECVTGWFQGLNLYDNLSYLIQKYMDFSKPLYDSVTRLREILEIVIEIYKDGECK